MSNFMISAFGDEIDEALEIQLNILREHQIHCLELRGVCGKNVSDFTIEEANRIKRQLDAQNFTVSAIGSPIGKIGIHDDFVPHLEKFEHTLELARLFNTNYIRIFSFYIPENENPESCREEVIRRVKVLTEKAALAGVTLLHENEKGIYGNTPERCLELLQAVDSPYLRATFDPANFIQCGVIPYPFAYHLLRDYITYIHIKDALFENQQVVPAGYGDGCLQETLRELDKRGFDGYLSIEPHLGYFPGLEKLEKTPDIANIKKGGKESFGVAAHALKEILASL